MDYEGGGETGKGMGDSSDTGAANIACDAADRDAYEEGVVVSNTDQSCWTRRVRVGKAPYEREPSPSRMPWKKVTRKKGQN